MEYAGGVQRGDAVGEVDRDAEEVLQREPRTPLDEPVEAAPPAIGEQEREAVSVLHQAHGLHDRRGVDPVQEVVFAAEDGESLRAWVLVPGQLDHDRPVVGEPPSVDEGVRPFMDEPRILNVTEHQIPPSRPYARKPLVTRAQVGRPANQGAQ